MQTKRILITGASSGIGKALALEYARQGARLILTARRREKLSDVASEVESLGGIPRILVADITAKDTPRQLTQLAVEEFGGIDIAIMNAGAGAPMFVDDYDTDTVNYIMAVNFTGVTNMIGALLPVMMKQKSGQLVAISSMGGLRGLPGSAVYSASKAAVTIFMESLRTELRQKDIAVTTIIPGFVRSEMTDRNEFYMPFKMETDVAARKIINAISKKKREYRFPWITSLLTRLIAIMPNWLYDRLALWGRQSALGEK